VLQMQCLSSYKSYNLYAASIVSCTAAQMLEQTVDAQKVFVKCVSALFHMSIVLRVRDTTDTVTGSVLFIVIIRYDN